MSAKILVFSGDVPVGDFDPASAVLLGEGTSTFPDEGMSECTCLYRTPSGRFVAVTTGYDAVTGEYNVPAQLLAREDAIRWFEEYRVEMPRHLFHDLGLIDLDSAPPTAGAGDPPPTHGPVPSVKTMSASPDRPLAPTRFPDFADRADRADRADGSQTFAQHWEFKRTQYDQFQAAWALAQDRMDRCFGHESLPDEFALEWEAQWARDVFGLPPIAFDQHTHLGRRKALGDLRTLVEALLWFRPRISRWSRAKVVAFEEYARDLRKILPVRSLIEQNWVTLGVPVPRDRFSLPQFLDRASALLREERPLGVRPFLQRVTWATEPGPIWEPPHRYEQWSLRTFRSAVPTLALHLQIAGPAIADEALSLWVVVERVQQWIDGAEPVALEQLVSYEDAGTLAMAAELQGQESRNGVTTGTNPDGGISPNQKLPMTQPVEDQGHDAVSPVTVTKKPARHVSKQARNKITSVLRAKQKALTIEEIARLTRMATGTLRHYLPVLEGDGTVKREENDRGYLLGDAA